MLPVRITAFLLLSGLILRLSACGGARSLSGSGSRLDQLSSLMTGTFNSAEQARRDSSYFDIKITLTGL